MKKRKLKKAKNKIGFFLKSSLGFLIFVSALVFYLSFSGSIKSSENSQHSVWPQRRVNAQQSGTLETGSSPLTDNLKWLRSSSDDEKLRHESHLILDNEGNPLVVENRPTGSSERNYYLVALNRDNGEVIWEVSLNHSTYGQPEGDDFYLVLKDEYVLVAAHYKNQDENNGCLLRTKIGENGFSSLCFQGKSRPLGMLLSENEEEDKDYLYVSFYENGLYRFEITDLPTITQKWVKDVYLSRLALDKNNGWLYGLNLEKHLCRYRISDGEQDSNWLEKPSGSPPIYFGQPVVAPDGTVLAEKVEAISTQPGGVFRDLVAIDKNLNGYEFLWSYRLGYAATTSWDGTIVCGIASGPYDFGAFTVQQHDGYLWRIYATGCDDKEEYGNNRPTRLVALDASSSGVNLAWMLAFQDNSKFFAANISALVENKMIYAHAFDPTSFSSKNWIYAIEDKTNSGEIKWTYDAGESSFVTLPVLDGKGSLYSATLNDSVLAFGPSETATQTVAPPQVGGRFLPTGTTVAGLLVLAASLAFAAFATWKAAIYRRKRH